MKHPADKVDEVTVYYFAMYDINADKIVGSRRPATLDAIKRFGGIPLMDTAQVVDPSRIDDIGLVSSIIEWSGRASR
jgi:hypothetical protein